MNNNHREIKFLILGGGPCGLGSAWELLHNSCDDFLIVEATNNMGGLAQSFSDSFGFTWDMGGHVAHSHYEYFDQVYDSVLSGNFRSHKRRAWIYFDQSYIPYPFQHNLRYLRTELRRSIYSEIDSQVNESNKLISPDQDYKTWTNNKYGSTIAKIFAVPYAEKVWSHSASDLNIDWVGDRVAPPAVKSVQNHSKRTWGPNYSFKYPIRGGNGILWKKIEKTIPQKNQLLNSKVIKIDSNKHLVYLDTNISINYTHLLSTIPLDDLIKITSSQNIVSTNNDLQFSTVVLIGIGVSGPVPSSIRNKQWVYFHQKEIPFFRATFLSNLSEKMAPPNHWSILTECSFSPNETINKNKLIQLTILTLKKLGLIKNKTNIVSVVVKKIEKGYPTPTLNRNNFLDATIPYFESFDIYPRGRFGFWKYEISNQDHTFMQGVEWTKKILHKSDELTITCPKKVNSNYNLIPK